MSDSTPKRRSRKAVKPKKPYPDFPLSPHTSGAWQKKIRGKIHYFGRWGRQVNGKLEQLPGDDWWKPALELYLAQKDDLHAGRTPRVAGDGLTVADLCNAFLTAKQRQQEAGELACLSFWDYRLTTDLLVSTFGKTRLVDDLAADDFEVLRDRVTQQWGPVRVANTIQRIRTVFKYGYESGLVDRPVRYGPTFKKPSASVLRRHRAQSGEKMLEPHEVRQLFDAAASTNLRAAILLGVNAGFGNTDVSELPLAALDLDAGWLDYPRPKTGILRRCPLWPETIAALREVLAKRPEPNVPAAAQRVFVNSKGACWIRLGETKSDGVGIAFRDLLRKTKLHRPRIGFYTLRHVFRTVADAARDPVAIDLIMGHSDPSMAAHYRERIEDSRLKTVTDLVHAWLFGPEQVPAGRPTDDLAEPASTAAEPEAIQSNDAGKEAEADVVNLADNRLTGQDNDRPMLRLYVG
jgi:integrase